MKGFPKILNSKDDYLYVREHFPRDEWQPHFQNLLDTMRDWFYERTLEDGDEGVTDDTHKVVVDEQEGKRYQYELRVSTTCKLFMLGFTENEVQELLASQ